MRKHLVFIDADRDYSRRLADRLKRISGNTIYIKCFANEEECLNSLTKINVDLVISDTEPDRKRWKDIGNYDLIRAEDFETSQEGNVLIAGIWTDKQNKWGPSFFYRYRPANEIYSQIVKILSLTESNRDRFSRAKVYYFDSPFGGSGVSRLSRSFASYLAGEKAEERVLYMSLCPGQEDNSNSKSSWSSIFLAAKTGRVKLGPRMRMREIRSDRGYFYFSNPDSPADILELENRDMKNIFKAASSTYDHIVIDGEEKMSCLKSTYVDPDCIFTVWPYDNQGALLKKYIDILKKQNRGLIFLFSTDFDMNRVSKMDIRYSLSYDRNNLSKDPDYGPNWEELYYER